MKFKVEIDSRWSYPCVYDVRATGAALRDAVRASLAAKTEKLLADIARRRAPMPKSIPSADTPAGEI